MKNNRTFLEKLLDGAEVEWKTLDEIFHLRNGYTPSKGVKEYWENGSIPWFRMEDIRENGRVLNTALQKVSESAVKGGKLSRKFNYYCNLSNYWGARLNHHTISSKSKIYGFIFKT